jgi:arylsulfatase A-like enzyme
MLAGLKLVACYSSEPGMSREAPDQPKALERGAVAKEDVMSNNVLLLTLDDLNVWATLKEFYPGEVHTPNLDALMARGTSFDAAFCQTALCNPSRTSLLTGKVPLDTGVFDNNLAWYDEVPREQTLHHVMRHDADNPYYTALSGKVYHTPIPPVDVRSDLFDAWSTSTLNWNTQTGGPFGIGPSPFPESQHGDFINADWAANFVNTYHGSKPFFLSYGAFKPHAPWVVPQQYFDLYPLASIKLPDVQAGDLADVSPWLRSILSTADHEEIVDANYWRQMVQGYLASISFADAMVGKILQALHASGHENDTTILLVGDNGYHLGEKDSWHKFTLWDEATRVPVIVVDPGSPQGQHITRPVELLDVYATILDIAGIDKPAWADGDSLMALVEGRPQDDPTDGVAATFLYGSVMIAADIAGASYRYLRYADGSEELYNATADRHEWTNLAGIASYADEKQQMVAHFNEYAARNNLLVSHQAGEVVNGSAGHDVLVGGHVCTLAGGGGDDTYHVAVTGVTISEAPGGGRDTVYVTVRDYTLADNVETGVLDRRGGAKRLRGNVLDNRLVSDFVGDSLYGMGGNDILIGAEGRDLLDGGDGNDTIDGGGSNDTLDGGSGSDSMTGGAGADRFVFRPGEAGVDIITDFDGGGGDKIDLSTFAAGSVVTFAGNLLKVSAVDVVRIVGAFDLARDVILPVGTPTSSGEIWSGTTGADNHTGTAYNDSLTGLGGDDTLTGLAGNDTIKGGDGNDVISGGDGDDYLSGNGGADVITDGSGLDSLYGVTGADRYVMTPEDGQLDCIWDFVASEGDKIDLGQFTGITLADVSFAGGILTVKGEQVVKIVGAFDLARDLTLPAPPSGSGEVWTGTAGADNHTGTAYADSLTGLGGADTLTGLAGNDTIKSGSGDDVVSGGDGDDFLSGNGGRDVLTDGAGFDSLYGGTEADRFVLTPNDGKLDSIWDFAAGEGDRVDLTLFSTGADVSFAAGVLTVDGEQVVRIVGDFSLDHLIR